MYAVYINGRLPKSKKEVKEAAKRLDDTNALLSGGLPNIDLENTSMFGGYSGSLNNAPDGSYTFVGPNPYTDRRFYGTITVSNNGLTVRVS